MKKGIKLIILAFISCMLFSCAHKERRVPQPVAEAGVDKKGTWVRCDPTEEGCPYDGKKYISKENN